MAPEKTFYLETFGCQMNAHDSEKVIGTLLREGYRQVDTEQEAEKFGKAQVAAANAVNPKVPRRYRA